MECISRLWAHRITTLFYRAFQRLEYIHPPMLLLKLRTAWSTEGKWHRKQLIEVWEEIDASVKYLLLRDRSRSNQRVDDGDDDKKKEYSWCVLLCNILINVPPKYQHIAYALVNVRLTHTSRHWPHSLTSSHDQCHEWRCEGVIGWVFRWGA